MNIKLSVKMGVFKEEGALSKKRACCFDKKYPGFLNYCRGEAKHYEMIGDQRAPSLVHIYKKTQKRMPDTNKITFSRIP